MADRNTTGAVHLTSIDLDISGVRKNLEEIKNGIDETAKYVRETKFTLGGSDNVNPVENNPLKDLPEQTEQAVSSTKNSIDKLIGQYLSLEKTITNFRATGNSDVFKNISSGIDIAIKSLSEFSETLKNGGKLTKENQQEINNLREQYTVFSNDVKTADNALLKSGESLDKQKNKIASLADSYNKLLSSLSKSGLDIDFPEFKKLQEEANASANSAKELYNAIKNGSFITNEQAKQFSALGRSLSDYNVRLSELKTNAQLTGEGLKKVEESTPDFSKYVSKIEQLNLQYKNFQETLSRSKLTGSTLGNFPKEVQEAVNEMQSLTNEVTKNRTVSEEQVKLYDSYSSALKTFKGILAETTSEARNAGEGIKDAFGNIKQFETLNESYKRFLDVLSRSPVSADMLGDLPEKVKEASDEMGRLTEQVQHSEAVTKAQHNTYERLSATLSNLKVDYIELKTKAQESEQSIDKNIKGFERLNLQFKNFQNTLAKSKLDDSVGTPLANIKERADEAAKEMADLAQAVQQSGSATQEQKDKLNSLSSTLITLKGELKDAETAAIQMGVGFQQAGEQAQTFGQKIEQALLKLGDRAKLMMSYQAIGLIQNALGNVVSTIQTTEDAVVDLQRVLTEDISDTGISKELYSIASEFGQTFENVQEVAIRFAQTGMGWQEVVDATRATMLGLNTAELEVTTATEGLIATINQFNIPASELETVIDKINITADHFPVTSEKIVAALQRAGGTASAFNMTLEETIATITTLAAQTGRSGETIGTVLNSLIIYTSKSKSLELFSGLSEDMDNVVKKFKAGSASIIDVWKQLGVEIDNLSKQQQSALFNSEAFKEFADTFESEASDYAEAIREIYGTAGTYRQNYLKVLLEDAENIEKVLENLSNAEGYSLQENEKYMNTLTAQWNQLVIAAKELAVQFGEMGILNFIKGLTQAATWALKLTKTLGGLRTITIALATAFATAKASKIEKYFESIAKASEEDKAAFTGLKTAISTYITAVQSGASATEAFSLALGTLQLTAGNVIAIIGLGLTAFSMIKGAIDSATEAAREHRQALMDMGDESQTQANSLYNAYKKLEEAQDTGSVEEYTQAQKELFSVLGYTEHDISVLAERYGSTDKALKELTESTYQQIKANAILAKQAAEQSLKDIETQDFSLYEAGTKDTGYLSKKYGNDLKAIMQLVDALNKVPKSADEAKEKLKLLTEVQEDMLKSFTSKELGESDLFSDITEQIKNIETAYKEFLEYDEQVKLMADANTWEEYFNKLAEAEKKSEEALKDSASAMEDTTISAEQLEEDLKNLSDAYDELSGKIDSFQSAYSTLNDVIEEYNETGIMTADMLQQLLSLEPEYIEMLNVQADSLSLNEQAVGNLINVNDNYLNQLVALKVAKEAEAMATSMQTAMEEGKTFAEWQAIEATGAYTRELQEAIIAELNGTATTNQLNDAILNLANSFGISGEWADYFNSKISSLFGTYNSLLNKVNRGTIGTYYTPKISTPKSSGSTKNPALEAQKEQLQNEVDALKKQKDSINDQYKEIEKVLKKQKEDSDKYYDSVLDNLKEQKEESDKYYDGLIDNLKRVQEENDRINAQLDYYADRQKILRNIEQARSRSGVEWREKEADYLQQLADLDESWRRKQEDWNIKDQISEYERLKQLSQEILEAQIKEMQELKKAAQDVIDAQIEGYKESRDKAIKEIEDTISALQEQIQALSKAMSKSMSSAVSSGISSGISSGVSAGLAAVKDTKASSQTSCCSGDCKCCCCCCCCKSDSKNDMAKNIQQATLDVKNFRKELQEAYREAVKNPAQMVNDMYKFAVESSKASGDATNRYFIKPTLLGIDEINKSLREKTVRSASESAGQMKNIYEKNFLVPIAAQIAKLAQSFGNPMYAGASLASKIGQQITQNNNRVYMNNDINSPQTAQSTIDKLFKSLQNNPSKR